MEDVNEAQVFLQALTQGISSEPDRYFYLWSLARKRTESFKVQDPTSIVAATAWPEPPLTPTSQSRWDKRR